MIRQLAAAFQRKAEALAAEVEKLRAEETATIAYAVEHSQALGEKYWHGRHRAEQQLRVARALAEILAECLPAAPRTREEA